MRLYDYAASGSCDKVQRRYLSAESMALVLAPAAVEEPIIQTEQVARLAA